MLIFLWLISLKIIPSKFAHVFWANTQQWDYRSYDISIFNFLRSVHTVFHNDCTNLYSPQQCTRLCLFLFILFGFVFFCLTLVILTGVKWYLTIVLICFSLTLVVLSTFSCVCWSSACLLWRNVYSSILPMRILFNIYLFLRERDRDRDREWARGEQRERGRHRIWRSQVLSFQHRDQWGAWTLLRVYWDSSVSSEGDTEAQIPGSELSAQSPTGGLNSKQWDHDLSRSRTLNQLSHQGIPAHFKIRLLVLFVCCVFWFLAVWVLYIFWILTPYWIYH